MRLKSARIAKIASGADSHLGREALSVYSKRIDAMYAEGRRRLVRDYVEIRDGGYYLAGSRVSLDSAVIAFQQAPLPKAFCGPFPSLVPLRKWTEL